MPLIKVRGIDHYYEWIRESETPHPKPVMVFIHGWGGSARYWQTTAQALSKHFDCLLYDLRGFGRSLLPAEPSEEELSYELQDYADDLAALLDLLHLDKVYIHSHSMGASVATVFINRYSQRVERAILTCNGIFEYDERSFSTFHKAGSYVVKFRYQWFLKVPFADKLFMARFLHRPIERALSRAFLEDFLVASYKAAVGTIYTSVSKQAAEIMPQEFAKIQVPTLLIAGEKDIIIPAAMGRQAAALNDSIEYCELSETAHFPMLENPSAYLKCVRKFLGIEIPVNV